MESAMSLKATWFRDRLKKKAKQGFRGYPVATVTYYGPNDSLASKVAVGIIQTEGADADPLERWFSEGKDIRLDPETNEAIVHFLEQNGAKSVVPQIESLAVRTKRELTTQKERSVPSAHSGRTEIASQVSCSSETGP
jgi:hypothetical protein